MENTNTITRSFVIENLGTRWALGRKEKKKNKEIEGGRAVPITAMLFATTIYKNIDTRYSLFCLTVSL